MLDRVRRRIPRPRLPVPARRAVAWVGRTVAPADDVAALWRRHPSIGGTYLVITGWSAAMAAILAVGPESRWSASGFATIRETGGPHVWAALWAIGAAGLIAGRHLGARWAARALWLNAWFCTLWALSLAVPPYTSEFAAWSGALTYGVLGILCVLKAHPHHTQSRAQPRAHAAASRAAGGGRVRAHHHPG